MTPGSDELERWLAAHPELRPMVDDIRAGLDPSRDLSNIPDAQATLTAARRRIASQAGSRGPDQRAVHWERTVGIAAVAIAMALMVAIGVRFRGDLWGTRSYATRAGQRLTVTLSDGTRFSLAPRSLLRVPVDYASGDRAVQLDGEALFEVAHDAVHPFSVRAGRITTTDIGTTFDVRSYAADHDTRVAVIEGRVGVGITAWEGAETDTIGGGDLAVVSGYTTDVTRGTDVNSYGAWTSGELVFRDAPAADVFHELGRWYDIVVMVSDHRIDTVRLTANYTASDPLNGVLDAIGRSLGERIERYGKIVVVSRPATGQAAGLATK